MKKAILLSAILLSFGAIHGQHEHPTATKPKMKENNEVHHAEKDTSKEHSMTRMHESARMAPMGHSFSMNLPIELDGSGTGWMPDEAPMYGIMLMKPKWMHMFHYNLFLAIIIRT